MSKTRFSTQLIGTDGSVKSSYIGTDATLALSAYTQQFRDLLLVRDTSTIETRINGKDVKHFDLILQDFHMDGGN